MKDGTTPTNPPAPTAPAPGASPAAQPPSPPPVSTGDTESLRREIAELKAQNERYSTALKDNQDAKTRAELEGAQARIAELQSQLDTKSAAAKKYEAYEQREMERVQTARATLPEHWQRLVDRAPGLDEKLEVLATYEADRAAATANQPSARPPDTRGPAGAPAGGGSDNPFTMTDEERRSFYQDKDRFQGWLKSQGYGGGKNGYRDPLGRSV